MRPYTLTRHVDADPDATLRALCDLDRLPDWNPGITRLLEAPASLVPGAEWVVEVAALGQRWPSRSRLSVLDEGARRFEYRSVTDDGNPSYAEWAWGVRPAAHGCEVTVSWTLHPATFWRRVLLGRVRQRQLRRSEVPASLDALARMLATRPEGTVPRG
jgi:uncharacterized protein YndB with AHSA1/START domain